jgi:hypothetical protein
VAGQLCMTTSWTQATSLLCVAGVTYLSSGTAPTPKPVPILWRRCSCQSRSAHLIPSLQVRGARHGYRLLQTPSVGASVSMVSWAPR